MSPDGGQTWGFGNDTKVFYDTNESDLTDDDKAKLDVIADLLNADSSLIATIAGYTDTVGTPGDNQTLSTARAHKVLLYLTVEKGVDGSQLTELGFGEEHLAVITGQEIEEDANRRTEITLDRIIYTGNLNVFRDAFSTNATAGLGLDNTDELTSDPGLGEYEIPAQPDRGIWMGLSMDVDHSFGENRGRIYIAFTDQGDLDGDPDDQPGDATDHHDTDIFVIMSDDFGATWTTPTDPVNDDGASSDASQFFSWLDVDSSTGVVAISWYDTRNDDGSSGDNLVNTDTQYFAAISRDSGATWDKNILVSDGISNPGPTSANGYGDYTGLNIVGSTIFMAWADNSDSTGDNPSGSSPLSTDIYFDKIRLTNSSIDDLLFDINQAIEAVPTLAGKFEAQADGNTIKIVATDPTVSSFTVTTNTADPAFRDLGIQTSATSTLVNGVPTLVAGKPAPTTVGQLTADAVFSIDLGSGAEQVTVTRTSTATNRNILDLVKDVQDAVDEAVGEDVIDVSAAGSKLMFTRIGATTPGTSDDFVITPITNAGELGISGAITSDEADLIITPSVGAPIRITLD